MRRTVLAEILLGGLAISWLSACAGGMASEKSAPSPPPSSVEAAPAAAPLVARESAGMDPVLDQRLALADAPAAPPAPGSPAPRGAAPATALPAPGAGEAAASRAPILVYTAQITMAVFEVNASLARVEAIGRELGGFLAKRDDQAVTIRVPAAAFQEAVKRIEAVGDMLHRNVAAEDVTEEFRDLEVRLKSARAVQARLTELLAKAVKVEESIAIEHELDRVSGEIERIEGRIRFLRDRAAFSTITVRFEPKPVEQVGQSPARLPVPWLDDLNLPRLLRL